MTAEILHSGFDGLRITVQTDISAALRAELFAAKAEAIASNTEVVIEKDGLSLAVRRSGGMAFSLHTGQYGAEWYILDPENRPKNNPGVTVDFRAFLLATGGLSAARAHFDDCMGSLGIRYEDAALRVSRVDFAVDLLAPWFEPDREAIVAPPGTRIREWTGPTESETHATGARVTGLRVGSVTGRQLVIYDKRGEVLKTRKMGWLTIWNHARRARGKPPLTLDDPQASRVWRFELRLGSKQLRNRWQMRSWFDLDAIIGDALVEFVDKVRYCIVSTDQNRARWPPHELWQDVSSVVKRDLASMRSGVVPDEVKTANLDEHKRVLDSQLLGLMVARASAEGVGARSFGEFAESHAGKLVGTAMAHQEALEERFRRAKRRYKIDYKEEF